MNQTYINLTPENCDTQHVCCAISDKKHQAGVQTKRAWLTERMTEGHTFRKLDANGKVFIEYAPLETAWVPVHGDGFLYIYCFWVSGSYKEQGHGTALLSHCIEDARQQGKSGVCVLTAKKKTPFLTDKKYMLKYGFEVVDTIADQYELLALSFDGTKPSFMARAREMCIEEQALTIYYGLQCPYIPDCMKQVEKYCTENAIPLNAIPVETLEQAKNLPCVFNNYAVFYQGKFQTVHLLNEGYLKKLIWTVLLCTV